jgi:uncharacterized protein (UPF0261 family)
MRGRRAAGAGPKTIAVIGALDTKGAEIAFLKAEIERRGARTFVIDTGVLGEPGLAPEVSAAEVAAAGGASLEELRGAADRGRALDVMAAGAARVVRMRFEAGAFVGIVSLGGGSGTAVSTAAMRALPVGLPKLMVTTVASGDTSQYVGITDIVMMPSIVDIAGLNRISRQVFSRAAGAICGMVEEAGGAAGTDRREGAGGPAGGGTDRPLIAATMFGNTTRAVDNARRIMEAAGYEVLVFHATGTGGRTMEMLIDGGYFRGVLDITTTEWADEVCGGVMRGGPARLEAAGRAGIPQVVTPACIDMCNFWAPETVPPRFAGRLFNRWNPNVTLMRTNPEENARLGGIFAEKLNAARGPVAVFLPMKGFSELDAPGGPFWWPEADRAFMEALGAALRPDIPLVALEANVNDPGFSARLAEALLHMLGKES